MEQSVLLLHYFTKLNVGEYLNGGTRIKKTKTTNQNHHKVSENSFLSDVSALLA